MKLQFPSQFSSRGGSSRLEIGFTLPEVVIALTIFIFVLGGIISANIFGIQIFQANQTKLIVTEWSRRTFGRITDEIRSCDSVSILNVDASGNFTWLLPSEKQQGNGLQIYPTSDTNNYTIYFVNSSDNTFRRTAITPGSASTIILADGVTNNTMVFYAQDLSGNVLTNNQNDRVIHLTLDFYQPASYLENAYAYQLETSVTRRSLK